MLEAVEARRQLVESPAGSFTSWGMPIVTLIINPKPNSQFMGPMSMLTCISLWHLGSKPDVGRLPPSGRNLQLYPERVLENCTARCCPNIGAFSERLHARTWSWLCDWQTTPDQWLDFFFCRIRQDNFMTNTPPIPPDSRIDPEFEDGFSYRGSYLEGLPHPQPVSSEQAASSRQLLQFQLNFTSLPRSSKSSALAAIMRSRTTVLSSRWP